MITQCKKQNRSRRRDRVVGFVVGPDKKIKLMLNYPIGTGRNFDGVVRVPDSIQLTAKQHEVAR